MQRKILSIVLVHYLGFGESIGLACVWRTCHVRYKSFRHRNGTQQFNAGPHALMSGCGR